MKAHFLAVLGILCFSTSLLADGNWVYLSGTITRTVQDNDPVSLQATTEKHYFLFDHTDDSYTRFRTFTQGGVKHYQNLGVTSLRGDILPSSRTLMGSIYNYQLITAVPHSHDHPLEGRAQRRHWRRHWQCQRPPARFTFTTAPSSNAPKRRAPSPSCVPCPNPPMPAPLSLTATPVSS